MIDLALIAACAPEVAVETIEAVIRVESAGNPLAMNVNGGALPHTPRDAADAAAMARAAIAQGYSVDLGLMQVNSRNLAMLGLSLEEVLEPCANIRAGAAILTKGYVSAVAIHGPGQTALLAALSAYNTGSFERGFENGYVARYVGGPAGVVAPGGRPRARRVASATASGMEDPYTASPTVYVREVP